MTYRLYVQPEQPPAEAVPEQIGPVFNWVLLDAGGDAQARGTGDTRETIEQTLTQNALDNVALYALLPGDEVIFCQADIPAKQARFIRQALPFAVEEQLAQDVESMHLALGNRGEQGYRVAAIDRSTMGHWLSVFSDWAHTRLMAMYADASLLPVQGREWVICLDGDQALVSSSRGEWLRMAAANLEVFAHTLSVPQEDEVNAEVRVALYGTAEDLEKQVALEGVLASDTALNYSRETLELAPLELLAHSHYHHRCEPINLCEGDFSVNGSRRSVLRPWRPLIAVACTWFVLQVALEIGLGIYQQQQADRMEEQAMAIYRQYFPADRRTNAGNVRRVIRGQLRQLDASGQSTDFLSLMKYAGQQYASLPGKESVQFNSINYTESRGELVVDLRADSFDRLSALRNGLVQKGLEADIGSVVNEPSGARGRLTISGG
ncbi:MAG: type II secretion system protein GspL [Marinobacter sp.]|uniref:type II secretion system protein GspL n=1 Tax=Marinobacter sp. TaxID=50741 RepID=UPI00299D31E3|nr:type II secretion system protein GspL [Marinobacter sp.]MDX1755551.1 type II secretion system protein GspL [Marinobacter sp.]